MKSIILTESERKHILENYSTNSKNTNLLKEELSKIAGLMGVKSNLNLISEEQIISKGIFSFPLFKGFQKYLTKLDSEAAENFTKKDISEFSQRLRNDGINSDNIADKAKKFWEVESGKGSTGLAGQEEVDLVNWFLKTKYADELANINTTILRTLENVQNSEVEMIINNIRQLNPASISNRVFDEVSGPLPTVDKSEVDDMIGKLVNSEKQCDKAIEDIDSEILVARTRGDSNTVRALNDQKEQWKFLKEELKNKKEMYINWKTNVETIYNSTPKTKVIVSGKEYDMTNLSPLQKFIYTNTITKQFQFLLTIAKMAEISQIGSRLGALEESIAGLRNSLGQPPTTINFKDIDAYTQQVISTMKAFTGRAKDSTKKLNWLQALNPTSTARTDFAEEWRRFLNILDASDLSDAEKEQIKKTLLERFSNPNVGKNWQLAVLYDDVKTILGRMSADENGKVLESEFQKSLKGKPLAEKLGLYADNFKKQILGQLGEYVKTILQTFIRFGFTGLVTGMRTAVAPLLKFGVNPKGLMRTFFRLYIIKTSCSVAVASIIYGLKEAIFGLGEVVGLFDVTTLGTEEWQNETWNSYVKDLQESFESWPLTDFSFGETGETGKVTLFRTREYKEYKYSEGIFRQYALEWFMEIRSAYDKTDSAEDQEQLNQETFAEWQKESGAKWTQNAIDSAGPEGVQNFVNEKTPTPLAQNAIIGNENITLSESDKVKIANHFYFKFQYTTESPKGFGDYSYEDSKKTPNITNKFDGFTPRIDSLVGQNRICETKPILQKDGTKKCKGKSWRADVFLESSPSTLKIDDYLKEYVKLGRQENGSGPIWAKARAMVKNSNIYFTNESEGNKTNPSVGKDMVNVEPISNILNKLK